MSHLRWRAAPRTLLTTTYPKKLWPRLKSKGRPTSQRINVVGVLHKLFCLHSSPVDIAGDVVELQFACRSTRLIALCRKISYRFGGKLADVIECRSTEWVAVCGWIMVSALIPLCGDTFQLHSDFCTYVYLLGWVSSGDLFFRTVRNPLPLLIDNAKYCESDWFVQLKKENAVNCLRMTASRMNKL